MKSGGRLAQAKLPTMQEGQLDINAAAAALPGGRNTLGSLSKLRERWINKIFDLVEGVPPKLPPWRLINHQINLINPHK